MASEWVAEAMWADDTDHRARLDARYAVLEEIGRGGWGVVYRARQRSTGQLVAVKVLRLPGDARVRRARFMREARLCAALHHPHIVRLIDADHGPGAVWTVFELLPGVDLGAALAAEGPLAPREAIRVMGHVLDGLAAAHARGVVHRDVKPSNVMLVASGARRNGMLLDFGVGAIADGWGTRDPTRLTATGELVGTPAYAAPEQLRGVPPTTRADLYAWGLTFVESLTGRRVIAARALRHILARQLGPAPIELPPAIAESSFGPLLQRALRKKPAERDVTAAELLDGLERLDPDALHGLAAPRAPTATTPATATLVESAARGDAADRGAPDLLGALRRPERAVGLLACRLDPAPTESTDPVTRDTFDAWFEGWRAVLGETATRFGGRPAGGFGATLVFAFDDAEDDPVGRAARAALAIARRDVDRGSSNRADQRWALAVHGARIADDVLASVGDSGALLGAAPARLAALVRSTAGGAILASSEALGGRSRRFVRALVGGVRAGGAVHRIYGELERAPRSPLVGRAAELDRLQAAWRAVAGGVGAAVRVCGPPGIGKRRLVDALADAVAPDVIPIELDRRSPLHPAAPSALLVDRLLAGAARAPALVVVHRWRRADPTTRAHLERLRASLPTLPTLLVLLDDDPTGDPPWAGLPRLDVGPLPDRAIRRLVVASTDADPPPARIDAITRQAAGCPLYAEHAGRWLGDRGPSDAGADLPPSIDGLLDARLRGLGPAGDLALWCALAGEAAEQALVEMVHPAGAAAVSAALATLVDRGLMIRCVAPDEARLASSHEVVHAAALRMGTARRRRAVAAALERGRASWGIGGIRAATPRPAVVGIEARGAIDPALLRRAAAIVDDQDR